MTENEAKTKWCPFARVWSYDHEGAPAFNRIVGLQNRPAGEASHCIGSICMAWRWNGRQVVGEYMQEYGGRPERRDGHCGLAGQVSS